MIPPMTLPVVANCAACETLAPSTRRGWRSFQSPRFRSTASAARPYGACSAPLTSTPPRERQPGPSTRRCERARP